MFSLKTKESAKKKTAAVDLVNRVIKSQRNAANALK